MEEVTGSVQPFRAFLRGEPENPGGEYAWSPLLLMEMAIRNSQLWDIDKTWEELRNRREEWGGNGVKNLNRTMESLPFFMDYFLLGAHYCDKPFNMEFNFPQKVSKIVLGAD